MKLEINEQDKDFDRIVKRVTNLQEEMIDNFYRIIELEGEIKHLKNENNILEEALGYWKEQLEAHYKFPGEVSLPNNLIAEPKTKKKPTTK